MDRNQAKEFYPILQAFAEGKAIECRTKPSALSKSWQGMNDWTEIKEIGTGIIQNTESSQNQSIVHSRMQKSAGQKCKNTSRLGGLN